MATHIYREKISEQPNQTTRRYEEKVVDRTSDSDDTVVYTSTASPAARLVYYILDAVELLLAARFLFRLFSANPGSPIVSFIYGITAPLVAPFRGIFANNAAGTGVLEWATLIAMIAYAIIAYVLVQLVHSATRPAVR